MRQDLVLLHLVILLLLKENVLEYLFIKRIGFRPLVSVVGYILVLRVRDLRLHRVVLPLQLEHIVIHGVVYHRSWPQIGSHWVLIVDVLLNVISQR